MLLFLFLWATFQKLSHRIHDVWVLLIEFARLLLKRVTRPQESLRVYQKVFGKIKLTDNF